MKGYWKIAFSCENGSLDRQWSTRTHRCVARLPRADAAVRRGPRSGDDGRARCGGVCKRAGAGMRVLAEVGELRAQAARRIPVSWALADPPCPTIMDAAAFRPPPHPHPHAGAKRVMPPYPRTRRCRPAHPRHGRAGRASPSAARHRAHHGRVRPPRGASPIRTPAVAATDNGRRAAGATDGCRSSRPPRIPSARRRSRRRTTAGRLDGPRASG